MGLCTNSMVCSYVRMSTSSAVPPLPLTHSFSTSLNPPFLSLLLCPCFSTSFSWSSHLAPSVPSLVRFDFFHLLGNLYFSFGLLSPLSIRCFIIFFLMLSFVSTPPSHCFFFLLPLFSMLWLCVCVLATGLPDNVPLHRSLCPINITA